MRHLPSRDDLESTKSCLLDAAVVFWDISSRSRPSPELERKRSERAVAKRTRNAETAVLLERAGQVPDILSRMFGGGKYNVGSIIMHLTYDFPRSEDRMVTVTKSGMGYGSQTKDYLLTTQLAEIARADRTKLPGDVRGLVHYRIGETAVHINPGVLIHPRARRIVRSLKPCNSPCSCATPQKGTSHSPHNAEQATAPQVLSESS